MHSEKSTTQGDPISMLFYGVALMLLTKTLRNPEKQPRSSTQMTPLPAKTLIT